jgi:hypothetical protein
VPASSSAPQGNLQAASVRNRGPAVTLESA